MEGMIDSSSAVTLVVKTPNRSIDDLQINCALNWTVEKLKKHLSSVYPSKPESTKQRLIYSGQLLLDHQTLQDFLREHQDGKLHTLHLVCPPSSNESSPSTSSTSLESSSATSSSTSIPSTPTTSTMTQPTNDGLRYRGHNTPPSPMFMPRPPMWSPGNMQQPFQPPTFPLPAQQQQHHQLWMQYMQQMYQHHQLAAANYQRTNPMFMMPNMQIPYWPYQRLPVPPTPVTPPSPTQPIPQTPPPPPPPPQVQPVQLPPPQPRNNQEVRMNAQGGVADDDDEENANNDWLDKIYTLCRVVILLSIVWFYSSTGRFLMMIASVLLIYMYQWGAFHWLFQNGNHGNQRVEVHLPPAQPQEQQQQQQQPQQDQQVNNEQGENNTEEDGETTTEPAQPAPPPPPPPGPSTLRVIVNFISTFFTSLIPQNNDILAN